MAHNIAAATNRPQWTYYHARSRPTQPISTTKSGGPPIPPTQLESAPPTAFPPPIIAKTKSFSSAESPKREEPRVAHAHVPFPSSVAEGVQEDMPRRIPQMSTARGRDGRRTQSGGVKGVIAPDPDPDPDPGMAEPDDDFDGNDF